MATNYTTKTAALKATIADIRKVNAKSVDAKSVDADKLIANNISIMEDGSEVDIVEKINTVASSIKTGVDIGTADSSFDHDEDSTGFLSGVSKINFKGAYVNVIKKDDGTVDLWINPDNNLPKISTATFTAPSGSGAKYVFASSSTDAYTLPTTAGSSYPRCHSVANDPTVKFMGGSADNFSISNLTSKLRVDVLNAAGSVVKTCSTGFIKAGVASVTSNNITITIGSVKEYTEADAANGFVPGTVSLTASASADISAIFGSGNTWTIKAYIDKYDTNGADAKLVSSEELLSSDKYFAYTTAGAVIGDGLAIAEGTIQTRKVSGIPYVAEKSTFTVTTAPITKATVMIGNDDIDRGTVAVTSCGNAKTISGDKSDTEATEIDATTMSFTLGSETTYRKSLTVTQKATGGNGTAVSKTTTYTGKIWSAATSDDAQHAYFEKEDSTDYPRILGKLNGSTLEISESAYDKEEVVVGNTGDNAAYYNVQAVVQGGTLIHPSKSEHDAYATDATTPKYYVRKFKVADSGAGALGGFAITIPGFSSLRGIDKEAWMYFNAGAGLVGRRIDVDTGNGGLASSTSPDDEGKFMCTVHGDHAGITVSSEFYVVIKLNTVGASITGDIVVSAS